jgi:membrane-associated phospholipid phosphatase
MAMNIESETASRDSGRLRRFFLFYIASLMGCLQVVFGLVEYGGYDFEPEKMIWIVPLFVPVSVALLWVASEEGAAGRREPREWMRWGFIAVVMFGLWAGIYFSVGRLTDPSRVRILPARLEAQIPFRPSFTLLYVLLYPIFVLPFFAVKNRLAFQRLVAADFLMFAACSVAFLAVPVAFDRPPLPEGPSSLGLWALDLVRGSDPPWNCLPSEHCAAAMVAALATWEADRKMGLFAFFTALLIGISTLFTKQHYLVDVVSGYGLAAGIHFALRRAKVLQVEPLLTRIQARFDRPLNR